MSVDIATLGIKVDATDATNADNVLDKLADTGAKTEASMRRVGAATEALNASMAHGGTVIGKGTAAAKLATHEMVNMSRQMSDVGVSLAMGMNPFMVLIQQGPQIADVLQTAGARGVTAGAAFRQMGASLYAALAPVLPIIAAVAAGAAVIAGGFAIFAHEANEGQRSVQASLGLTEKQMKRLKDQGIDTSVTMGDSFKAFFQVTGDRLKSAFDGPLKWLADTWDWVYGKVRDGGVFAIKAVVGVFFGGYAAIKATWGMLPSAFADIAVSAANGVIAIIESMVNKVIAKISSLTKFINDAASSVGLTGPFGDIASVSVGRISNPNAGAASRTLSAGVAAFDQGYAEGGAAVDRFGADMMAQARRNRDKRVRDAAGDAGGAANDNGKGATNDAAKEAENFLKSLREETAEIGKNRIELKAMAVERAAAAAPTKALADAIRAAGEEWKKATIAEATADLKRELADSNEALAFETNLLGMNARERAVAVAQREIDLKLRALERQGITVSTDAIKAETEAVLANAAAKGQRQLDIDNARAFTDALRSMNDAVRESVDSFGELFGTAGEGFKNLVNVMTDYGDRRAEIEERIAEATARGVEGDADRRRATRELAQAEIGHYGDILGAAKGFFNEKSKGYKILQAAESAYRLFQFAMSVKAMLFDSAETASSVAKSGIRAAAHGVEAVVKAIASLPFPFNLLAGAATAAAITALGVTIFGGGKSSTSATGNLGGDATADNATNPGGFNALSRNYNVTMPSAGANDNSYNMPTRAVANGYAGDGGMTMKVTVNQNAPGVVVESEQVGRDEIRLMIRQGVQADAAKVVATDMAQPNSQTSKAVKANFEVLPRR